MSVVAAAVCPHPPLIVPEIAAGAAAELDPLRAACDAAIARLRAARPERFAVVGAGRTAQRHPAPETVSFAGFGRGCATGAAELPLGLAVGVWLLRRAGVATAAVDLYEVPAGAAPDVCAVLGAGVAGSADRVALLAMGDGSACRSEKAPGYLDPRAEAYDRSVLAALAAADRTALLALDGELSAELLVAGRAPWQVLAGATAGTGWRGRVDYAEAPYGVGYAVASWEPA